MLNRLLPGELSRDYEIRAVVINEKSETDDHDWYPLEVGLEKIYNFLGERRLQYAYVELEDKAFNFREFFRTLFYRSGSSHLLRDRLCSIRHCTTDWFYCHFYHLHVINKYTKLQKPIKMVSCGLYRHTDIKY